MILRKPYAFLIKYFKLIHVFLVVPLCYLLYRTNVILNFFQEYMMSEKIISGRDFTGELFNNWMFILPFIIMLILIILLGVMFYKKKPKIFYIYNILVIIALLIIYNFSYNVVSTLEAQVIETRMLRLVRDILFILILFQGIGLILTFIRATGFDIKKFDFNRDLEQLDITEADAEEFELDINVETNVFKRELKKNIRFAKYIYVENKFLFNTLFLIIFSVICFLTYMNLNIYNKTYKQGQSFLTNEFMMTVNNSYLTNQSYKGKQITDNYLLIIELDIKARYDKITLNTTKLELKIKDGVYHPTDKYGSNLIDLGTVYNHGVIDMNSFQTQLLVYEIPKELISEKMTIKYLDNMVSSGNKLNPKYIKVKLNPYNLDKQNEHKIVNLNDSIQLNETILNNTSINITDFEIQERFKLNYKYCIKKECYESVEYLNPILNTNYDKVLLKIDGEIDIDEELNGKQVYRLYNIINYFGKIKYQVGEKTKYYNNLKNVIPKKDDALSSCYIEIPKEIMDSKQISFILDIRDKSYEYIIK